jgi:hypothetical protein
MPVRNACIAAGSVTAGSLPYVYTVPASSVLLLKAVILDNESGSSSATEVILNSSQFAIAVRLFSQSVAATSQYLWSGWVAMNAGDTIQVYSATEPLDYWLSGAVLPYWTS